MRKALVKIHNQAAGILTEVSKEEYIFQYNENYNGSPISLTMPVQNEPYLYKKFPAFFDGLLPEGVQLEGLLKINKIDKTDYFKQLVTTGLDLVGAVTVINIDTTNE